MVGRVATAAIGVWSATWADLSAALWVAANARKVVASLRTMFEMQLDGGTVVSVPANDPVICTLIQLDGDVVTLVMPGILKGRSGDELDRLIEQHQAALEARLPVLRPGYAESLVGFVRSLSFIVFMAQFGTVFFGVGASWAQLLATQFWAAFRSFVPYLVIFCVLFGLRRTVPYLLGRALHRWLLPSRPSQVPGPP